MSEMLLATPMFGQVGMAQTLNAKRPIELVDVGHVIVFSGLTNQFHGRVPEDTSRVFVDVLLETDTFWWICIIYDVQ